MERPSSFPDSTAQDVESCSGREKVSGPPSETVNFLWLEEPLYIGNMIDKSQIEEERKKISNIIDDLASRERINGVIISVRIESGDNRDLMMSEFETVDGHLHDFKKVIKEKIKEVSDDSPSGMYR